MSKPVLQIVIASTRPGRVGKPIGSWLTEQAVAHGGFEVQVSDLLELALPLMNEAKHPRLHEYELDHTKAWSEVVSRSDAFVFVMPEYNYSFTAPLKNAIDYLNKEWKDKAVGFASYGGVAGGTRAVQAIKQVVTTLKMVPVFEAVTIPFVQQFLDEEGRFVPNEVITTSADAMLDELVRLDGALSTLRATGGPA